MPYHACASPFVPPSAPPHIIPANCKWLQVLSSAAHHPWGYPFTPGPRAAALAPSKRSRRVRALQSLVGLAVASVAGGAGGQSEQPLLTPHSALRLDQPTFWMQQGGGSREAAAGALCGVGGGVHELTGPADPLLLLGCVSLAAEQGHLLVTLTATCRWEYQPCL